MLSSDKSVYVRQDWTTNRHGNKYYGNVRFSAFGTPCAEPEPTEPVEEIEDKIIVSFVSRNGAAMTYIKTTIDELIDDTLKYRDNPNVVLVFRDGSNKLNHVSMS